jgi:hypothetical protein
MHAFHVLVDGRTRAFSSTITYSPYQASPHPVKLVQSRKPSRTLLTCSAHASPRHCLLAPPCPACQPACPALPCVPACLPRPACLFDAVTCLSMISHLPSVCTTYFMHMLLYLCSTSGLGCCALLLPATSPLSCEYVLVMIKTTRGSTLQVLEIQHPVRCNLLFQGIHLLW